MRPRTHYVETQGARLAYQVVGDGPVDLVFVPGFASHVELQWADPGYARFLRRLGEMARLLVFDKRGAGLSTADAPPTLEQRVGDIEAVMDAAGSSRAVLLGFSDGGPGAALLAATRPERCAGLVLCETFARGLPDTEGRIAEMERRVLELVDTWGQGRSLELMAPTLAGSALHRRNFGLFERAAIRPEQVRDAVCVARGIDVTAALPAITAPTLVLHRRGDFVPIELGRQTAALIPGARFMELDGADHVPYAGDPSAILREIEGFLAGLGVHAPAPRQLATILFTDVVGSTQLLVERGDAWWRDTVETHDAYVRAEVEGRGGRVVKSTGDGSLSAFRRAGDALEAAWAVREQVDRLGLRIRAGVHTGEIDAVGDDVSGIAVHTAARVMAQAGPGEILLSAATRGLVGDVDLRLEPRGAKPLRGLQGRWPLFALVDEFAAETAPQPVPARSGLRLADRLQVGFARRAPAFARALAQVAG